MKRMTVLFEDEQLYTAIRVEAARRNIPLKTLVTQALADWLRAQEEAEDIADAEAAMKEYREKGGVEATEFFRQLRADGQLQG